MNARQAAYRPGSALYPIAALSLIAGLIHLLVMPEHFEEWWGYGTFFLVAAVAQIGYVPILLLAQPEGVDSGCRGQLGDHISVSADAGSGDTALRSGSRGGGGGGVRRGVRDRVRGGHRRRDGRPAAATRQPAEHGLDGASIGRRRDAVRPPPAPGASLVVALEWFS